MQRSDDTIGMRRKQVDKVLTALVLVRIGQELGTESQAARLVHDIIEFFVCFPIRLFL